MMAVIEIEGGVPLEGSIRVSGSKNGSLPLLAASLLCDGELVLHNVPWVVDVQVLCELLPRLGVRVRRGSNGTVRLEVEDEKPNAAPYELVDRMRASICVLGPLVARRGSARIAQPGGCSIGPRPIDIHLRALEAMGANVRRQRGEVTAKAARLKGAEIDLLGPNGPTVLGTCNTLSAAVLAEGRSVLLNAAREPEVAELASLLVSMGAKISGIGGPTLTVHGVPSLHGAKREIIPDRIEAGTYMIAAAITRGRVRLENVRWEHMGGTVDALRRIGVQVEPELFGCLVTSNRRARAVHLETAPYPGVPTDLQAPFMSLLSVAEGESSVTDTIFPSRFTHVDELNRFGANITVKKDKATIHGVRQLSGALVTGKDLRACAAMIVAGLAATPVTTIREPHHIDRGYECIEEKLSALGATIRRVED